LASESHNSQQSGLDLSLKLIEFSTKQSERDDLIDNGLKHERNSSNDSDDQFLKKDKDGLLSEANMQVIFPIDQAIGKPEKKMTLRQKSYQQ
jgi:hypothetical protein